MGGRGGGLNTATPQRKMNEKRINQSHKKPQQIISFHRTLQREKHKHLRSPQHRKLRFYSPHQKIINTATPQHRKSLCPPR